MGKEEQKLRDDYDSQCHIYKAFGDWVTEKICAELVKRLGSEEVVNKFLKIPPVVRVKNTDSFIEKALIRKKEKYKNPLLHITDKVGIRFVVLLLEDIELIGKIIRNIVELECKLCRDFEREKYENPDHFTYQSIHYVVNPKEGISSQGVTIDNTVTCEIQIRTILQHAYAEISHISDYKPDISMIGADKRRIRRELAKGSALIEITDETFKEVQNMLKKEFEPIDVLLQKSAEIYKKATGEEAENNTNLSKIIATAYIDLLKDVKCDDLSNYWLKDNKALGSIIKGKRDESVFYKDSVIIPLAWLISQNRTSIPKSWPENSNYLEDFYIAMGYSTSGLF